MCVTVHCRTEAIGLRITRPPEHIGRYKTVPHRKRPHYGNKYVAECVGYFVVSLLYFGLKGGKFAWE